MKVVWRKLKLVQPTLNMMRKTFSNIPQKIVKAKEESTEIAQNNLISDTINDEYI